MKVLVTGGSGFIGTNFHEYLSKEHKDIEVINVDIRPPKEIFKNSIWENCDILQKNDLKNVFDKHNPDCVVHLAAETSCEPDLVIEDYRVNIEGSQNVFECANENTSVKTVIHTSTQFVNQKDFPLLNLFDYKPHTIYGESKVQSEEILRRNSYRFKWLVVRPTNVWGKWHLRYPHEFWKVLKEGKYIHPKKRNVIRSYAYVQNVCDQIMQLIFNIDNLDEEVYYVGDPPILLYDWVNEFSLALRKKKVRIVPRQLVFFLAKIGDFLAVFRIKFPITSSRYRSMTHTNPAPMEKTYEKIGYPKVGLKEGVRITADWLEKEIFR